MSESERFASSRPARPPAVGADHEDRGRLGEQGAVALRELRFRAARKTAVGLVHAARERPVAEDAPHESEEQEADHGEGDPEAPTAPAPSARSGRTCGLRRLARRASEWDSALLAAAAIQPVGLVSLGHRGRYGSPAVRPSVVIGPLAADLGGVEALDRRG